MIKGEKSGFGNLLSFVEENKFILFVSLFFFGVLSKFLFGEKESISN